jgi:peptide/nickel transport system substrate-binding protein
MPQRFVLPVSLAATISLVATGCGAAENGTSDQDGAERYAVNGTFTMVMNEDRGAFDPYRSRIAGLDKLAYDSLVNMRPDGTFVSGIAQKWTTDARTASFTLRPDVTCSDGTPLTAGQVAADLEFIGDPENKSPQYGINTPTVPFTVTADDKARTVRVTTKEPFGFLLNTVGLAPIVCAKGLKDPKLLETASHGTGPFVLTKVVPGQSFTFSVRRGYAWGPGGATTKEPGTPATVVLRIITNETTAANLLLSGEVNQALITGAEHQRLTAQGLDKYVVSGPGAGLRFNQAGGRPAADRRVRQALVHALDLNQVVKVSTGGTGRPATGLALVEPKACAGDTVTGRLPRHDVATAEALLDQAGWTKGADGTRTKDGRPLGIELLYPTTASIYDKATAELIAEKWKAIGVRVRLAAGTPVTTAKTLFESGNWDVYTALGIAYLPSAWVPYLSGPLPPGGQNLGGANEDYEKLTAKAQSMTPPEACAYWNQAEHAIYRDVDIVPISDRRWTYFLKNAQARSAGYEQPVPTSIRVLR